MRANTKSNKVTGNRKSSTGKITKKLEAEILNAYKEYWDAYLKGDIRTMSFWMHDNIHMIGSGRGEFFSNKKDTIRYYKSTAGQVTGKADMRNRKISAVMAGEQVLVNEECDFFVLIKSVWTFYGEGRISTVFTRTNKGWKIIQEHGSIPDARTAGGEQLNTNKVKAENVRLKEAVKRRTIELEERNRELKVESALERVRTVAMGMKKPGDMLIVCKTISKQLTALGVKEIRNVQTAIFYESHGTYMNYEYYAKHDKSIITETSYTNNKIHKAFAKEMLKGKGKIFTSHIKGKKVKDWLEYQKTTNVFIDKYLKTASSLNYYWHSLGPVALGISTYIPLTREETELFQRFLKVFELSYRRYLDIEKAEAQARESQIQLALERIRARTMAMRKSEELQETAFILFKQFQELGEKPYQITIGIFHEEEKQIEFSITGIDGSGAKIDQTFRMDIGEPVLLSGLYKAWKRQRTSAVFEMSGEELRRFDLYRNKIAKGKIPQAKSKKGEHRFVGVGYFSKGFISFSKSSSIHAETLNILERFAGVFDLTYTRFLDLQKAEAQAREAKIEAALERVRSRSLAMHKSDELKEVIRLVLEQFIHLKIKVAHAGFYIDYKTHDDMHIWLADPNIEPYYVTLPYFDTPTWNNFLKAKAKGTNFHTDLLSFEEKNNFYQSLFKLFSVPEEAQEFYLQCRGLAVSTVLLDSVGLYIENFDGIPYSEEDNKTLMRFGKVFQQTYTRFLDLQKAEAQARESQIQLALERVRARTMAMQRSDELGETTSLLLRQFSELGYVPETMTIGIIQEEKQLLQIWFSGKEVGGPSAHFVLPLNGSSVISRIYKSWKSRELSTIVDMTGDVLQEHTRFLHSQGLANKNAPAFERLVIHAGFFSKGYLGLTGLTPLPAETVQLLERFSSVFDITYTRFLDLRKAEAQAREAQIEAALERVRSRSLSMQKSNELNEVVYVVFERLQELGFEIDGGAVIIDVFQSGTKEHTQWIAQPGHRHSRNFIIPYSDHTISRDMERAMTEGKDFFSKDYTAVDKNDYFSFLFQHTDYRYMPDETKKTILESEHYNISAAFAEHSSIVIPSLSESGVSEEQKEILKRFTKVFDQTYTRFLDLQKAEAQTREAQIEAALEKVRSRSLAMHQSGELQEVVNIVFERLQGLEIKIDSASLIVLSDIADEMDFWVADPEQSYSRYFTIPYFEDTAVARDFIQARKEGKNFIKSYSGKEKNEQWNYLFQHTGLRDLPDERKKIILNTSAYTVCVNFTRTTALQLLRYSEPVFTEKESETFQRFANVFEQAYTRFLDLQKAEAQAREAQIEAALERVRSRTLAMQKSDELAETAAVLFQQLIALDIEPNRLYIILIKEDNADMEAWVTDEDGSKVSMGFTGNFRKNRSLLKMYEGWKEKRNSLVIDMQGEELKQYFNYLHDDLRVPFKGGLEQKRRVQHIAYFSHGLIGMASPEPQPAETLQLLERFAAVFNLTFTRFNDLKIAEAHAAQAEQDLIAIKEAKQKAEETLTELQSTQRQLIQSEKMASLGELTAGIAHEIQNPLNFVNNFSEVSRELLEEMREAMEKGDTADAKEIMNDVIQNLEKINHHGKRADGIVKGMLQHSRAGSGQKELTDINALCDEYLRLAFHGLRAKDKSFNAKFETQFDEQVGKINVLPQDMGRVILNLINNAFYAVTERKKLGEQGFEPTVIVCTEKNDEVVMIKVKDNGTGIPQRVLDKIFQPFFTTKPAGQGTGLGLSLSYDIIKAHDGELRVETKQNEGSSFIIQLPASA